MLVNIQINTSSITQVGNLFVNELKDFENNINQLRNLMDTLSNDWQGNDAIHFIQIMKERNIVSLQNLLEILKEYSNYLLQVSDVYRSLEESFSSKYIG